MEAEQQGEDVAIGAYKLINIDVDPEFGADCKAWATSAITSYHKGEKNHFQDVAKAIKQDAETKYGKTFHVIVGKSFGSFVSHEASKMAYFFLGSISVLVFKHG